MGSTAFKLDINDRTVTAQWVGGLVTRLDTLALDETVRRCSKYKVMVSGPKRRIIYDLKKGIARSAERVNGKWQSKRKSERQSGK